MIDSAALLRAFLLSKSPIFAITNTRIWGERITPIDGYLPSQGGAIVFRTRGGNGDYTGQILTQSWMMKCYGVDEDHAGELYRVVFDNLNEAKTGGMWRAAIEVAGAIQTEPILGWVYSISYWTTMMQTNFVVTP